MTKPFNLTEWARLMASFRDIPIVRLCDQGTRTGVIALRHDVDADLQSAVEMARLEAAHGIRSTYFMLDTASYWEHPHETLTSIEAILYYGHEIGWHNNVVSRHIRTHRPIPELITETLEFLRSPGAPVTGTASHGDPLCREYGYVNYDIWKSNPRPTERSVYDLTDFGLAYEAYFLPRTHYISESGGIWRQDNEAVVADFRKNGGILQVLLHPQWWQL